jgi:predicted lipoprotein with Yx(FWY)xxD motif
MRNAIRITPLALAASVALAACGSSSSSSTGSHTTAPAAPAATTPSATTVKTASSSLGTILVDAHGMTLYSLSAEQGGKFICSTSACTGIWHPLTVSAGGSPSGEVGSLGTVKRPDGTTQVTYKGMPLYTFAQDLKPGQTNGQGIKDVGTWGAVTTTASTKAGGSSSEGGSKGYAY